MVPRNSQILEMRRLAFLENAISFMVDVRFELMTNNPSMYCR